MNNEYRRRHLVDPDKLQESRNTEVPSLSERQVGRDPTPSQISVARERWRNLVSSLPQQHVDVINYRMHGMTQKEIAERTGLSTRTVRRIIERALKQSAVTE
jgi:RNA polymerase sigma factor (sigma-70 family)